MEVKVKGRSSSVSGESLVLVPARAAQLSLLAIDACTEIPEFIFIPHHGRTEELNVSLYCLNLACPTNVALNSSLACPHPSQPSFSPQIEERLKGGCTVKACTVNRGGAIRWCDATSPRRATIDEVP
ncbi:hypothetical protein [Infirmifilum sp. NZ]|uniref:hypothetical protein n=1 Tax=Infirmifilum sp. NZ TaxID=2926850 RepID=UPI00279FD82C|nr:hypothetical protein [Infirmifilum sp. NZ]UNQ73705.1 hypothetical protein MOV14_01505 [Infirmifilum sp. NZ]